MIVTDGYHGNVMLKTGGVGKFLLQQVLKRCSLQHQTKLAAGLVGERGSGADEKRCWIPASGRHTFLRIQKPVIKAMAVPTPGPSTKTVLRAGSMRKAVHRGHWANIEHAGPARHEQKLISIDTVEIAV